MKLAKELNLSDKCYFYDKNGNYLCQKTIKTLAHNDEEQLFLHFGFNKNKEPINAYPMNNSYCCEAVTYCGKKLDMMVFFSKDGKNKYFTK